MNPYRNNPKRQLAGQETLSKLNLEDLAKRVKYTGSPSHKRSPGDFGLNPPVGARPGKSLCDNTGIMTRAAALRHLRQGICRGAVCGRLVDGWPRYVWAVTKEGMVLEAIQDGVGSYHGYPVTDKNPMSDKIKRFWRESK